MILAVLVRENKSPCSKRMVAAAIANGFLLENGEQRSEKGSKNVMFEGKG